MKNEILCNLFLTDYKMLDRLDVANCKNSIERILKRYSLGIGDYENNELTEALFIRLGWSNKFKDTLLSFRSILYSSVECFSNPENNSKDYEITLDNGAEVRFYNKHKLEYTIGGKSKENYCYSKKILFEKCNDKTQIFHKVMMKIFDCKDKEIVNDLNKVAELSDAIVNFMPHPGFPFNQAKGCLEDVSDSLNLMVDKIQVCVDNKEDLKYGLENVVEYETLKTWREWFINNQKFYCLEDFYDVSNDKIVGKKLFETQGLSNPYPKNTKELKECLLNIIDRFNKRAEKMSKSVR